MCTNCPEITPCIEENCTCDLFIKSDCVTEVTVDLPCSAITKGKPLNEVLIAFDAFVCSVIENFNSSYAILKNVGIGVGKVYKGVSLFGEREIKSIKGTTYININNLTDEVEIAVNEATLITLIEATSTGNTNLTYTPSLTNGIVNSDTGTDAIIPLASSANAGLITPAEKVLIASIGTSNTNLNYIPSPTQGLITNSTGTNATVPTATNVNAGLLTPVEKTAIATIPLKQDISNQIEVGTTQNVQNTWHGKTVIVTAPCTLTVPAAFTNPGMTFEIVTLEGATVTWAITTPKTWLFGAPTTQLEKTIATFMQRLGTNSIMLLGQEIF